MSLTPQEEARLDQNTGSGPHVAYLVRRETHSSRAIAAIVLSLLVIVVAVYLVVEGILAMCGAQPLLATPTSIWDSAVSLPGQNMALAIVIGAVLAVLGLVFLVKALAPGSLSRHAVNDARAAYIVDDQVIASALSRAVREHAGLEAGQVSTSVSGPRIRIAVKPTSGLALDEAELTTYAKDATNALNLKGAPRCSLTISKEGQVAK